MTRDVWVLGATGRTGRAVVVRLRELGVPTVLVGRDAGRLAAVAEPLGARTRTGTLEEVVAALPTAAPAVVVNTVGPFTTTAPPIARACPPGTHYVDVANEIPAFETLLALHAVAEREGRTIVTGAGFGVLAAEAAVLRLMEDEPAPERVRVAVMPSVASEEGRIGTALAATIVGQVPEGGRAVRQGRLVSAPPVGATEVLTTPEGEAIPTTVAPFGELLAAWRASGAREVSAASSLAPSGPAVRLAIPAADALLRIPGLSGLATAALARVPMRAAERPRAHSWAHARATWSDGRTREAWLRLDDALDFTAATAARTAHRLLEGEGRPGSFTPGSLFGPELALAAGAEFTSVD